MAQNFRAGAWEHLDKGDLPQASNKAWGLVSETVKASALTTAASSIPITPLPKWLENCPAGRKRGDMETRRWINGNFMTASSLHSNFYENEMPEDLVLDGLMLCEELSESFTNCSTPPATTPTPSPRPARAPAIAGHRPPSVLCGTLLSPNRPARLCIAARLAPPALTEPYCDAEAEVEA